MKYVEISRGNGSRSMVSFQHIISIETAGNYLNIEYPNKTVNLLFTSTRSTSDSDAMRDLAYDKIKKLLEKL